MNFFQRGEARIRVGEAHIENPVGKLSKRNSAHSVAPDIPMSLIKQKSCSAKASTILESHFHGAKVACRISFAQFSLR